jgi:hypothetical protein
VCGSVVSLVACAFMCRAVRRPLARAEGPSVPQGTVPVPPKKNFSISSNYSHLHQRIRMYFLVSKSASRVQLSMMVVTVHSPITLLTGICSPTRSLGNSILRKESHPLKSSSLKKPMDEWKNQQKQPTVELRKHQEDQAFHRSHTGKLRLSRVKA